MSVFLFFFFFTLVILIIIILIKVVTGLDFGVAICYFVILHGPIINKWAYIVGTILYMSSIGQEVYLRLRKNIPIHTKREK